ncbi:MAG: glycosyltransferase family 4 protein [Phycisphaerales bacterium]|nr:MAG: glycosyltransferase family 4 protein [Phycisphaerales bacterium]
MGRRQLYRQAMAFDAVFLQRKTVNPWDAFWLRRYCPKLIYDFDDAIMYSDRSPERRCRGRLRRFRRTVATSDVVIAGNDYLAAHARHYSSEVHVLPTALDLGPYSVTRPGSRDRKRRLVWIGSRSTLKYLAGMKAALEEIGRRHRDVVLRIVADAFFDLQNMAVEKVTWSHQAEAMSLLTSDIGLAPLPDDAFSRGKCGFKVLQYQAAALPVVTSPVGVNAEYVRDGVSGLHASGVEAWIGALSRLLGDAEQRAAMGRAGREEVVKFDLKLIGRRLEEIIRSCVQVGSADRSLTRSGGV